MFDENEKLEIEKETEECDESVSVITEEKEIEIPKKKVVWKKVLIAVLCVVLAGGIFTGAFFAMRSLLVNNNLINEGTSEPVLETTMDVSGLTYSNLTAADGELTIEAIAESCLPSVVSITNKGVSEVMTWFGNYQTESISSGSGIIIGKNDDELLIVTNYHVVADSKELTVVFAHDENADADESNYMNIAKVKGYDADKDVAVIAVKLEDINSETMQNIKIAVIGNSNDVKLGSRVVAIGNALGYGQSVTHGIVSAVRREITMQGVQGGKITNAYIQTDAAINSGNSGGALLNMRGELIGINSAKISYTGVEGMGYAIPITDIEKLISDLMVLETREIVDEDKRGYLGIYGTDVTRDVYERYSIPVGLFVHEIIEGSPAEKSKLEEGDIIVKIDGFVVNTMADLQDRLMYYKAGEIITLSVKRDRGNSYEDVDIKVTLGTKKEAGVTE